MFTFLTEIKAQDLVCSIKKEITTSQEYSELRYCYQVRGELVESL